MEKSNLLKNGGNIIRILEVQKEKILVIDCVKVTMPKWISPAAVQDYNECTEEEFIKESKVILKNIELLDKKSKRIMQERYTLISGVLPFVSNEKMRSKTIEVIAKQMNVSKQTIRHYLCLYLIYQNITILAPKQMQKQKELTQDEKNMRWALNKFFYNRNKNSITTAYTMMLKEKYCDVSGKLLPQYPSIHQFRYFYSKNKKMQNYYISRDGLKSYQRNHRPLLGEGVQEFAPNVGVGMLDATVCDIYLVNDSGNLVGRPILTTCIDAYSGLCCGYSLSWEGGVYSLRNLMLNVITDKVEHCKKQGIIIRKSEWDCDKLPAVLVTDMGSEYISENFEQIAELGVKLINLPPYRPELKGSVEKFFDLIQGLYKKHLKGKGVIEPDFRERGSHDYRKDACLTMEQFEKILMYCIVYYNSKRIIENYPFTEKMIKEKIQPFSNEIWNYGCNQIGANLIKISKEELIYSLLPRTQGKFTRHGLVVNGLRYKHDNYTQKYLVGGIEHVAYNPENVSQIWLIENGNYIQFSLIESRFKDKDLLEIREMKEKQKQTVKTALYSNLQSKIELTNHIEAIMATTNRKTDTNIKGIRSTRKRERMKTHMDYIQEVGVSNE